MLRHVNTFYQVVYNTMVSLFSLELARRSNRATVLGERLLAPRIATLAVPGIHCVERVRCGAEVTFLIN